MINYQAIRVIYKYEMLRAWNTLLQTIASPVISTSLYFVVFGAAIGSRIEEIEGVSYGVFIVPGLVMLSLLTQSIANASFGIFFPKFTGTIYEVMSAPISFFEILVGYVGAAASVAPPRSTWGLSWFLPGIRSGYSVLSSACGQPILKNCS